MSPPEDITGLIFSVALPYEVVFFFLLLPEASKKSARPIMFIVVYLMFSTELQQHCKVDPVVSGHQEYKSDILCRNLKFQFFVGLQ